MEDRRIGREFVRPALGAAVAFLLWLAGSVAHAQTAPSGSGASTSADSIGAGTSPSAAEASPSSALPAPGVTSQYSAPSAPSSAGPNTPVAPSAATGNERVLTFRVGASETSDSNVFAQPANVQSDRTTALFAGLRVDKPVAQQRFYLDATETAYRHQNLSYLDFDALQYQGAWDWVVSPRVSGTLSAARSQALVNYNNFQNTSERNVVTTDNRRFSVDGWLSGGWHVLLGASQDQTSNSVTFVQQGSYRANGASAGIRYVARSGNSITLTTQSSRGSYVDQPLDPVNLIDDGFRRIESDVAVSWALTGKSSLGATLGWMDYRSDHFSQRSFSGAVGQVGYNWRPTGKLSFTLFAGRNLVPFADPDSSYVVSDTVSVGPTWQITSKTSLRASIGRTISEYRNPVVLFGGPARQDTQRVAQIGLDWRPTRTLTLSASAQRTQQSSTDAAFGYGDTTAQLTAGFAF